MNRSAPLRRTGPPRRRVPLPNGNGLARTGTPRRRARIATKPRRQSAHNPFPMSAPPGFWHEMMRAAAYTCRRCHAREPFGGLSLSRLVPGSKGGPYTAWNCRVLCGDGTLGCHHFVEAHPEQAEAEGWRVPGYLGRTMSGWGYIGPDASFARIVAAALAALEDS